MTAALETPYQTCPECGGPTTYPGVPVRDRQERIVRWRFTCMKYPSPHTWNVANPDYSADPETGTEETRVCTLCQETKPAPLFVGSICADCIAAASDPTNVPDSVVVQPEQVSASQEVIPPAGHEGHKGRWTASGAWRCNTCIGRKTYAALSMTRELSGVKNPVNDSIHNDIALPLTAQRGLIHALGQAEFEALRNTGQETYWHGYLAGAHLASALLLGALGYDMGFLEVGNDNGNS